MNCKFEFLYHLSHDKINYVNPHKHNCFELVYYMSGSGYSIIDGQSYRYSPNSFVIIEPGFMHYERHLEKTEVIFIGFTCDSTEYYLKSDIFYDNVTSKILILLEEMKNELASKQTKYNLKLNILVCEILIEISRMKDNNVDTSHEFTYIKKFLNENFHQNIAVSDLARLSGYSYHHFRRLFKQKTGLSPTNYIIRIRFENAIKLLTKTNLKISAIADSCGFASTSQFCSMFKKAYGKSPTEFRKSINSKTSGRMQHFIAE